MRTNRKLLQMKKMIIGEKIVSILLMVCMCISMTACGNRQVENSSSTDTTAGSDVSDTKKTETTKTETAEGSKTLVVYFSATGNTKAIAEKIADGLSADIHEIIAKDAYTDADLDYNDDNSRSTVEMKDGAARPAISGGIKDFEKYTSIYLGYPIWWGEAPRILSTFVESYDLKGKTVIPFCTSSSSGIGSSAKNLEKTAKAGQWLDGKRFSGSESKDEVMEWAKGL